MALSRGVAPVTGVLLATAAFFGGQAFEKSQLQDEGLPTTTADFEAALTRTSAYVIETANDVVQEANLSILEKDFCEITRGDATPILRSMSSNISLGEALDRVTPGRSEAITSSVLDAVETLIDRECIGKEVGYNAGYADAKAKRSKVDFSKFQR